MEGMAKPKAKPKSAMDVMVDSLMRLRAEARKRMTPKEFDEADRQVHELAGRVRARAARQGVPARKYRSSEKG
jgi:hypothetical protein